MWSSIRFFQQRNSYIVLQQQILKIGHFQIKLQREVPQILMRGEVI